MIERDYIHALNLLAEASESLDGDFRSETEAKISDVTEKLTQLGLGEYAAARLAR